MTKAFGKRPARGRHEKTHITPPLTRHPPTPAQPPTRSTRTRPCAPAAAELLCAQRLGESVSPSLGATGAKACGKSWLGLGLGFRLGFGLGLGLGLANLNPNPNPNPNPNLLAKVRA